MGMFKNNNIIGIVAFVVIVGCVGRFFYKQLSGRTKVNVAPFSALGALVADETSKLLPTGGKVVVLSVDTAKYNIATLDTLLSSFKKGLKRGITILSVEHFRIPSHTFLALNAGSLVPPSAQFAPGQFERILQTHGNADAIVSFVGLPASLIGSATGLQQKHSKIIVVSNRDSELLNLLRSRVIDLAIVPRVETPNDKGSNNSSYEVLTSDK
jgi:hypothetical protein